MFHLVNKYGNVHKKVESERKRDELIASGYRLAEKSAEAAAEDDPTEAATVEEEPIEAVTNEEEPIEAVTNEKKPKKGKAKKNDTKE